MRKFIAMFVVFTIIIVMIMPVAAFASGRDTGKNPESLKKTHVIISDGDGSTDTSLGETDGACVMALGTVGPTKYTESLSFYSPWNCYYKNIDYTANATGFYTFSSLTNQETDIYFALKGHEKDWFDRDVENGPFSAWVYLVKGVEYTIQLQNFGSSSSISYLVTTPCTLGKTGYTISPRGYSTDWMQAFDFDVPSDGDYSIHIANPSGSSFYWALFEGEDYPLNYIDSPQDTVESEYFHTFSLSAGSYHLALWLYNSTSKTASFTISMDNADGSTTGMTAGTQYSGNPAANDILTANYFIPSKDGNYTFPCDRNDSKVTVSTVTEEDDKDVNNYLIQNVSPNTAVSLDSGTKYYIFYVTDGTPGALNYSAHYIASEECDLISVDTPFTFNGHLVYASADSAAAISPTISDGATWDLYSDKDCTTAISHTLSADGLNRAYLKVTAEDGTHSSVYPVLFYLTSAPVNPAIVAYDPDYNEISDGSVVNTAVDLFFLGKPSLSAKLNGGDLTISGDNSVSTEGDYTVDLTDGNSNSAAFGFAIDKTKPVITAASGGNPITAGQLCNKDVTVTVSDSHAGTNTAKNGTHDYPWPAGGTFTEDGSYVITANDAAGNTQTFSFTLDKTAPVITAKDSSGNTISSGNFGIKPVTVTVPPDAAKTTATKNSAPYKWPSKSKFTSSGTYVITAEDAAKNITTFTFTIDSSSPVISVKADKKTIKNNGTATGSVTATASDPNLDEGSMTVKYNNGTPEAWTSGDTFTKEGIYELDAYDMSGNKAKLAFKIDLKPVLSATDSGAADVSNTITTKNVHVTYSDLFIKSKTITRYGTKIAWPDTTSSGSFDLTNDGIYSITLQDKAGNKSSVKFTIDKSAPVITVVPNKGAKLADNDYTNKPYVTVTISDLTKLTVKSATLNGSPIAAYPSSGKFSAEGVFVITATDSAGHTSTFTFTIDKTAPQINASSKGLTVLKGSTVTSVVDLSVTETNISAISITKDGADYYQYPRDASIWDGTGTYTLTQSGSYVITVTDKAGNKNTTSFKINLPIV